MSFQYIRKDPNEALEVMKLLHFPDTDVMDIGMIAACIHKSMRTVYRMFKDGELSLAPGPKVGAYAKDVKAWALRKFCGSKSTDGNAAEAANRKVKLHVFYWKDLHELSDEAMTKKVKKLVSNN